MVGRASKRRTGNANNETSEDAPGSQDEDVNMMDVEQMQWNEAQQGTYPGDPLLFPAGADPSMQLLPSDLLSISGLDDLSFYAFPDSAPQMPDTYAGKHVWQPGAGAGGISGSGIRNSANTAGSVEDRTSTTPGGNLSDGQPNSDSNGSSNGTSTWSPPATFPMLPITMSPDFEKYDAVNSVEPIFVLARIALYLENQLRDESLPLDKTLMVVKGSLKELMDQVNLGYPLVSIACRALIFASIQNIVKLYMRSLAIHRRGAPGQPEAHFKLGSFEIDPEDQLRLQNQAIAAELGRCIREIKKISKSWSKACDRGENCKGVQHYHTLEKEMQKMREDIETAHIGQISEDFERVSVHDKRLMHPLI